MKKPTKSFIDFYRHEGNYNLLNSSDVSAQYIINGIDKKSLDEKGLRTSFLINIEYDNEFDPNEMTVLELLDELQWVYENKYLYNGRLKDIAPLREHLESVEEEQEVLRHQYKVDYATYKIDYWTNELQKLTS